MALRLFAAIELPDATRDLLARARDAALSSPDTWTGGRAAADKTLHITLCFIGDPAPAGTPEMAEALRVAAARHAPFRLAIAGMSPKPSPGRASMLWAAIDDPSGSAATLAMDIGEAVARVTGNTPDLRRFAPHVTLARARRPRPVPQSALDAAAAVLEQGRGHGGFLSVPSFTLYSSTLTHTGPVHEALETFDLTADGPALEDAPTAR